MIKWKPSDYVLHHRFATTQSVASRIKRIALDRRAATAAFCCWTSSGIFRALTFTLDLSDHKELDCQLDMAYGHSLYIMLGDKATEITEYVQSLATKAGRNRVEIPTLLDNPLVRTLIPKSRKSEQGYADALVSPHAFLGGFIGYIVLLIYDTPGISAPLSEDEAADIAIVLNCHPAIRVIERQQYRHAIQRTVEEALHLQRMRFRHENVREKEYAYKVLGGALRRYLKICMNLINVSAATLYIADRFMPGLKLLMKKGFSTEEDRSSLSLQSVAQIAYENRRPFVANDLVQLKNLFINIEQPQVLRCGTRGDHAIAMPIMYSDLVGAPVIIVVALYSSRPFIQSDLSLLETSTGAFKRHALELAFHYLEHLAHVNRFPTQYQAGKDGNVKGAASLSDINDIRGGVNDPRFDFKRELIADVRLLPAEVVASERMIVRILSALMAFTPSSYGCFQALSSRGDTLMKHLAATRSGMADNHAKQIAIGDIGAIDARVARTGHMEIISCVADSGGGQEYSSSNGDHSRCKSIIAIPVFAGRRLIGILRLESIYPYAYDDSHSIGSTAAACLGACIQRSRHELLGSGPLHLGFKAMQAHAMRNIVDELRGDFESQLSLMPESARANIEMKLLRLRRSMSDIDVKANPETTELRALSLKDMIVSVLRAKGLITQLAAIEEMTRSEEVTPWYDQPCLLEILPASVVEVVQVVLDELFHNIEKYGYKIRMNIRIRGDRYVDLGGIKHVRIIIGNDLLAPLPDGMEFAMFSRSHNGGTITGVGTVIAACFADSIGARLFVHYLDEKRKQMDVGFDIPLSPSRY